MDFEKIKDFLLEKKSYIIIILALGIGGIFFLKGQGQQPVDNGNLVTQEGAAKSSSTSYSSMNAAQSSEVTQGTQNVSPQSNTVTCDIAGAVKEPGVYTLKNGARLDNLLKVAGGSKKNANLKQINRALILKDQDQIYIPYKGEKIDSTISSANNTSTTMQTSTSSTAGSTSTSTGAQTGEKIHLNSASTQDLQKLSGIGEKKAEQIINYREQNGGFKSIDEITKVSGIGEKTFEKFKDQLEL